jgi:hypothetical protein
MWNATDIHTRLAAVRATDPDWRAFGASHRRNQLGPGLTESEITLFETDRGVTLPASYRSFLLTVSGGGAGPGYGMFPLDGTGMRTADRAERFLPGYLATPFPHTQSDPRPSFGPGICDWLHVFP